MTRTRKPLRSLAEPVYEPLAGRRRALVRGLREVGEPLYLSFPVSRVGEERRVGVVEARDLTVVRDPQARLLRRRRPGLRRRGVARQSLEGVEERPCGGVRLVDARGE